MAAMLDLILYFDFFVNLGVKYAPEINYLSLKTIS